MVDQINNVADKRTEAKGAEEGHADWTKHAPPGGVQINGVYYGGGKFIPNEELKKASPEEIAELNKRIELSERVGPEQAKKIIDQEKKANVYKEQEQAKENAANSVQENIYIIDDGVILGGQYGEFVIKRSNTDTVEIIRKEAEFLNTLGAKRLDVIFPTLQKVLSITTEEWPLENTVASLQNSTKEIPFAEYTVFNNISAKTKSILTDASNVSKMSLYRLSLNNNVWDVENQIGKKYSLRVVPQLEAKTILFIHNVYNYFGIPTSSAILHEEGILEDNDTDDTADCPVEESHIKDTYEGFPLDSLFALHPKLGKKGKRLVRKNLEPNILKFSGKLSKFPEEKSKEIKEKLTPELIDEMLEKINYPKDKRQSISLQLLEGLK